MKSESLLILRRLCQLSVLLLFCSLPWLNSLGIYQIRGSLFAFDAFGVPFADPASAAQAAFAGGVQGIWPASQLYLGVGVVLLISFLCGRIFCGWLCPYGLFSELTCRLKRTPFLNANSKSLKTAFMFKLILAFAIILLTAIFALPLTTILSFPGQISLASVMASENIPLILWLSIIIVPLIFLILELVTGSRLWCRYICPQSVFLGLSAATKPKSFPGLRIGWNAIKCVCGKKDPCRQACSLGINPRKKGGPARRDCSMCGACVSTCARYGNALNYEIKQEKMVKRDAGDAS